MSKAHAGLTTFVVLALALQMTLVIHPQVTGHNVDEMTIHSRYASLPVAIDGVLSPGEWSNAAIVNLSLIPINSLLAHLLVQNNDTMLFIAYDVLGDQTEGANDSAGLAFDGDHNGAPTIGGDGEYSVKASNDSACLPFDSMRCHYTYSGSGITWTPEDAMDQARPYHAGLMAEVGFGPTPLSSIPHRTYEFSIPLVLLGRPTVTIGPGDVVGFLAGRHVSPEVGVWDPDSSRYSSWPEAGIIGPNEYGNLKLASRSMVSVVPWYSFKPTNISRPAVHEFTIFNTGSGLDSFDVFVASPQGWTISLYDNASLPLVNRGGNMSLPDLGPLTPGSSTGFTAIVIPLPSAVPGDVDTVTIEVRPWSNQLNKSLTVMRSMIPYLAPWSDNLDGGNLGWYFMPRPVNDWALGIPDPMFPTGPSSAHSAPLAWGTDLSGNHSFSSFSLLESPQVLIPDYVAGSQLLFWHWYDIIGPYGDGAWVELSIDGGDWEAITPEGDYPGYRLGGEAVYTGTSGGWVQAEFNLTDYRGSTVAFRFVLWDWLTNGEAAGWYIDDVTVTIILPPAGLQVTPTTKSMVGVKLESLEVQLNLRNVGSSSDVFDITSSQVLGWPLAFLDSGGSLLSDTEIPPDGFVDTGPVPSGSSITIRVNVTIPNTAIPGSIETVTVVLHSSVDITVSVNGQYKFQLAVPIPFLDEIESGLNGWSVEPGGLWHQIDSCLPTAPPWFLSYSPCHSWWYGLDVKGNYDNGRRTLGNLTMPPIELTGVAAAHLRFRQWYHTEPSLEYDQRWILVKLDNEPWPMIGNVTQTFQLDLLHDSTWLETSLNISAFIGHIIQIRFFFDSIDGQNNAYQGWYVDDVNVSVYTPGSTPPNIYMTRPSAGDRWSAAKPQTVEWVATDDLDLPSALKVWVNFSLTGSAPWFSIPTANGVGGDSSPVTWTPPCVNLTNAALNGTVIDSLGLKSWTGPIRLVLDCANPQVLGYQPQSPPSVSVKTNISITFNEAMNITSTETAFSLQKVQGWVNVAGSFSWVGNTLYFDPMGDLEVVTTYQANLTVQALDISEPGNNLASPLSWQFITSSISDMPPHVAIVSPTSGVEWSGSRPGSPVFKSVSWVASDDFDVKEELKVWVNYTLDGGSTWVPFGVGQPFNGTVTILNWLVPCVNSTNVAVEFVVIDTGGRTGQNNSGFFEIDCSPPKVISHDPVGLTVHPDSEVVIAFNESMNKPLTEAAFSLEKVSDGGRVAGLFTWNADVMRFTPALPLIRGESFQVNLTTMATDSSDPGNKLESLFSWGFSVSPLPPPTVNATNPAGGSTGVSIDLSRIEVTLSSTVFVLVGAVNITPYVNFSVETAGNILVIRLWRQLSLETTYTVRLNAVYIVDMYGNRLDGDGDEVGGDDYVFSFTTGGPPGPEPLPTWIWMLPLVVVGFIATLLLYRWRRKKDEERSEERKRPRREERTEKEEEVEVTEDEEFLEEEEPSPPEKDLSS